MKKKKLSHKRLLQLARARKARALKQLAKRVRYDRLIQQLKKARRRRSKLTKEQRREIRPAKLRKKLLLRMKKREIIKKKLEEKGIYRFAVDIFRRSRKTDQYSKVGTKFVFNTDARRAVMLFEKRTDRREYCFSARKAW